MLGTARTVRRAAARIAEVQTAAALAPSPPVAVKQGELRQAIGVIIKRSHAEAEPSEHAAIAKEIAAQLQCDERTVLDVVARMAEGGSPEQHRHGAGRPYRIKGGSPEADCLLGGLLANYGARQTARLINASLDLPRGVPLVSKSVVMRTAKGAFGLVVGKSKICKTGSRDAASKWATSRLAICEQFERDIAEGLFHVEGTLYLDEHSEFCVLGKGGHRGNSSRWEWRAHRDESESRRVLFTSFLLSACSLLLDAHALADGRICLPEDGGVLDAPVPRPRAKHPARADGMFGVCAPFEAGGRRQKGKRMRPIRYKGIVVGMKQFAVELLKEQARVRALGLKNRANVADPEKNSRPGQWYDHCGPGVNPYEVSSRRATNL